MLCCLFLPAPVLKERMRDSPSEVEEAAASCRAAVRVGERGQAEPKPFSVFSVLRLTRSPSFLPLVPLPCLGARPPLALPLLCPSPPPDLSQAKATDPDRIGMGKKGTHSD